MSEVASGLRGICAATLDPDPKHMPLMELAALLTFSSATGQPLHRDSIPRCHAEAHARQRAAKFVELRQQQRDLAARIDALQRERVRGAGDMANGVGAIKQLTERQHELTVLPSPPPPRGFAPTKQ